MAVSALSVLQLVAAPAENIKNSDCFDCHAEESLTKTTPAGKEVSVFVDPKLFAASVHRTNSCVSCHQDVTSKHPDDEKPAKPVNCATCHADVSREYADSIHGISHRMGESAAASCADCHGRHDMLPVKHPASPVYKLNLPDTCAQCHANTDLTAEYHIKDGAAAAHYIDSIHGQALLKKGLIVAPSCNDCHGVHDIRRSVDRSSPINHQNIAKTCGQCHLGVEETYNASVHGKLLATGHRNGPVCTDCHTAHEVETPVNGHFKQVSDQRCGKCHQDSLTHYYDTYHGKAMALGKASQADDVAACYDCHGHHDVLPPTDPDSRLSSSNIVATCQQCHPKANPGFASYRPHANPLDKENYPVLHVVFLFMTGLLISVFIFFGLHTIAWLVRAAYLYWNDSKKFREAKFKVEQDDEWFTRFAPFERFLHFLVVTSFLLLVITGMPLKFYYTDWAKTIFSIIGGPESARALHRFGAIVTFLYFGLHVGNVALNAWRNRGYLRDPQSGKFRFRRIFKAVFGPDSMVPTWQDWHDFVAHNKWFFGKAGKPQFDRWTYWEKFDYFAVFWGVFIIGASGLVMWFPEWFTQFLPGWIINVALIIHSDEALLAAGFIFTIHFFNTHFRLEKFPMDTVIFSGRISKTEMLHERRRWYDRLVKEGRLDRHRIRDEWERWKGIAKFFGFFFFGLGLVLLVLIVYAMVSRLSH